ncbi:MAG: exodeoxyribonuclease VII small subunit [Flavobacteriales bacterium]|nr:exodeoxyribonuclease VII small subunit [Flavobacteriales bacterium]
MSEELNYETAYGELKGILSDLQNDDVTVDELTAKVKRAKLLLELCQKKLANVDADVNGILQELREEDDE